MKKISAGNHKQALLFVFIFLQESSVTSATMWCVIQIKLDTLCLEIKGFSKCGFLCPAANKVKSGIVVFASFYMCSHKVNKNLVRLWLRFIHNKTSKDMFEYRMRINYSFKV